MSHRVKAVIARSVNAPVEVVTIVVPDPGPGEALVTVQACGVCHTDLHYRQGGINDEFPFLLGPEAASVMQWLRRAPLDLGFAAEEIDADGRARANGADGSLGGLLAYTIWYAAHTLGVAA